jgi:stage II sporulation protein AA (anti-sigma F factor antagonist)
MKIEEVEKGTLLVAVEGEIDHHSAAKIRSAVDSRLSESVKNVIFDFSELKFMDSSGVGMIMGRYKKAKGFGGRIFIAAPPPEVRRIIDMAGLFRIAEITPNVKRAVKKAMKG